MFSIQYSPDTRILEMQLKGRWTEADFDTFERAYLDALRQHSLGGKSIALLSDSREFQVQTQEVADRFSKLGAGSGAKIIASAIVASSLLNKMQVERTMASDRMQVFLDLGEARTWLTGQLQDAAA